MSRAPEPSQLGLWEKNKLHSLQPALKSFGNQKIFFQPKVQKVTSAAFIEIAVLLLLSSTAVGRVNLPELMLKEAKLHSAVSPPGFLFDLLPNKNVQMSGLKSTCQGKEDNLIETRSF